MKKAKWIVCVAIMTVLMFAMPLTIEVTASVCPCCFEHWTNSFENLPYDQLMYDLMWLHYSALNWGCCCREAIRSVAWACTHGCCTEVWRDLAENICTLGCCAASYQQFMSSVSGTNSININEIMTMEIGNIVPVILSAVVGIIGAIAPSALILAGMILVIGMVIITFRRILGR